MAFDPTDFDSRPPVTERADAYREELQRRLEGGVALTMQLADLAADMADLRREMEDERGTVADMRRHYASACKGRDEALQKLQKLQAINNELRHVPKPPVITPAQLRQAHAHQAIGERIQAIKLIRDATGWGLRDAKDFCDALQEITGTAGRRPGDDAWPF